LHRPFFFPLLPKDPRYRCMDKLLAHKQELFSFCFFFFSLSFFPWDFHPQELSDSPHTQDAAANSSFFPLSLREHGVYACLGFLSLFFLFLSFPPAGSLQNPRPLSGQFTIAGGEFFFPPSCSRQRRPPSSSRDFLCQGDFFLPFFFPPPPAMLSSVGNHQSR